MGAAVKNVNTFRVLAAPQLGRITLQHYRIALEFDLDVVTQLGKKRALSAPKNRGGKASTKAPVVAVDPVEAARSLGGQMLVPPEAN